MIGVLVTAAEFIVFWILIYLGYIIYAFVYIPLKIRRKYYKYSNVGMWKERYPFIWDLLLVLKNEREKKFRFQHYLDTINAMLFLV